MVQKEQINVNGEARDASFGHGTNLQVREDESVIRWNL